MVTLFPPLAELLVPLFAQLTEVVVVVVFCLCGSDEPETRIFAAEKINYGNEQNIYNDKARCDEERSRRGHPQYDH